jgi:hypothetical protein
MRSFLTFFLLVFAFQNPVWADRFLQQKDIEETVIGRVIYIKVPLGGEIPLVYQQNGVVKGSGEGVGLGKYMAPKDQGTWWIKGTQLCQKWQTWYDGRPFCFQLKEGENASQLRWYRDDGKSGLARIGAKA